MSIYFALYLLAIIADGDYQNDWITHLPLWTWQPVEYLGWALALALGY